MTHTDALAYKATHMEAALHLLDDYFRRKNPQDLDGGCAWQWVKQALAIAALTPEQIAHRCGLDHAETTRAGAEDDAREMVAAMKSARAA